MTTVLSIDVDERTPVSVSGAGAPLNVRRWEGHDPRACDVEITVSRTLPPWLLREILSTAADRLIADDAPRLKLGPTKRKVAA